MIQIILWMSPTKWNWVCEDIDDPDEAKEGMAADFTQACNDAHKAHDEMHKAKQ